MRLYKTDGFVADPWRSLGEDESPGPAPVIVSLKRWQALGAALDGVNVPLGLRLDAGDPLDAILADLPRLSLVALAFPKFNDGRSFSKAALLRGQYRFQGEIRATGEVLWDQLQLMRRCGFDAFEISDESTARALDSGKQPFMTEFYQPGIGAEAPADVHRPWARRTVGEPL